MYELERGPDNSLPLKCFLLEDESNCTIRIVRLRPKALSMDNGQTVTIAHIYWVLSTCQSVVLRTRHC